MDLNVVILGGRLAAPPDLRRSEAGSITVRYLVTVRSGGAPHRVDVLPVTHVLDGRDGGREELEAAPGRSVWIAGSLRRRFRHAGDGARSTIEVVARQVELKDPCHEMGPAGWG